MLIPLQSDRIRIEVAHDIGGRICSFVDLRTGYDFLWRNERVPLRREAPGAEYDPNFFGGIEELLPNDIPESIDGIDCPDHGELWTLPLACEPTEDGLFLTGELPGFGLRLERWICLEGDRCAVRTRLENTSAGSRRFLWKLHAAVRIEPGDRIECDAASFTVADPKWSRREGSGPWEGETVPEFDGSTEFLYLQGAGGHMYWRRAGKRFGVRFDPAVFRYAWYFASYGGFDGHHVAILEPCTCMPISVNEASALGQCSLIGPGEALETEYEYYGVDQDRAG